MSRDDVGQLIQSAREAQRWIEYLPQADVDKLVAAVGWASYSEENVRLVSEMAHAETGLGDPQHLFELHRKRVLGTLGDLHGVKTTGVIREEPERGLRVLAKPVGVIAVASPATAPCSGVSCNAIQAIKTRNAMVFSPNPRAWRSVQRNVELMRAGLSKVGAPPDLLQSVAAPDRYSATRLMADADLVIAAGGHNTVRRAYKSGTPAIAAGVGNPTVIVDESADLTEAAEQILFGTGYNNGTSCSSESNVLVHTDVLQDFLDEATGQGAHVCSPEESTRVRESLVGDGQLNRDLIGRSVAAFASSVGLHLASPEKTPALVVPCPTGPTSAPFLGEKLSPIVSVIPYTDFNQAVNTVEEIINRSGKGHSCGIYTKSAKRVTALAERIKTCRVMVNQSTLGSSGSFTNGLPFTSTVSVGTWGGSSVSENVTWKHMLNYTFISQRIPEAVPSPEVIFGEYWDSHREE